MTGNIIGEPFERFVQEQIAIRQLIQFGGYRDTLRTQEQLQYLNNRNAWVKLASSVYITPDLELAPPSNPLQPPIALSSPTFASLSSFQTQEGRTIKLGESKLTNIGIANPQAYLGTQLAEKAVLFNSLSSYIPSSGSFGDFRAGVSNDSSLWNNSAYGLGGINYGLQAPPGIINVQVDSLNRGSIRKASVTLKAHNKFQFDVIELLYLRLGFTMMLEWGWDKYLDKNGNLESITTTIIEEEWFISNGTSQLEMIAKIQNTRARYFGNYDGFFGKVSNFSWVFNPDGSYDITIDLITIGDVVESLKVNTSIKESVYPDKPFEELKLDKDSKLYNTNIAKASTLNTIGSFLYKKVREITNDFSYKPNENTRKNYYDYITFFTKNTTTHKSPQYYIRLGELLLQLENLIIPKIQNDGKTPVSQITFQKTGCYISYFPNQIPLDPRICIFKPSLNSYGDITGIIYPKYFDSIPLPYLESIDGYTYGILMNLYINFEFISELLISNGGPDQELFLFKFLQDLCNGVNNALGGVNKLEPIIKDDYKITIIDQTLSKSDENNVSLEVYGYNSSTQTSNFVKDIKFISKITPQLASMITIGATAAGGSTSEIDGTAFSKWSEGLTDRFSREIFEPNGLSQFQIDQEKQQAEKTIEEYKTKFLSFKRAYDGNFLGPLQELATSALSGLANVRLRFAKLLGYENRVDNFYGTSANEASTEYTTLDNDLNEKRIITESRAGFESINGVPMTFNEYSRTMPILEKQSKLDNKFDENELNQLTGENYAVYLANAFGGEQNNVIIKTPTIVNKNISPGRFNESLNLSLTTTDKKLTITSQESRYLEFDNFFISQGKSAYQTYIKNLNNVRYKNENIPSNEVGFIPLSFDLTLDGISGIKIYNKLNINNEFLPSNYPQSLSFIITKVNHTISNNNWDTSLSTISIPKTQPYKFNSISNSSNSENINIIGPQPDNSTSFIILDGRNNRDIITLDSLLLELDPIARPAFKKFFDTLIQKYSGYKAIVNDVRRTWEESYNLKYTPGTPSYSPSNAEPGKSRHNHGLAIDINIETPASTTERTLSKDIKQPWIEEGIDKVAIDSGLTWGGNFTGYVDAVHFEFVNFNFNTPYDQILAQAKAIDPTLVPPFTPFANGLEKCRKIDNLIKQGKIKLQ